MTGQPFNAPTLLSAPDSTGPADISCALVTESEGDALRLHVAYAAAGAQRPQATRHTCQSSMHITYLYDLAVLKCP